MFASVEQTKLFPVGGESMNSVHVTSLNLSTFDTGRVLEMHRMKQQRPHLFEYV